MNLREGGCGRPLIFSHELSGASPATCPRNAAEGLGGLLVLIDVEAASTSMSPADDTRASVSRKLFRTRVTGGLLGDFSFDSKSDISERLITILRVDGGGGANMIVSFEGAVIDSIERPQASLVR